MLGFSVNVQKDTEETIGYWIDHGQVYSSLKRMIELDQAEVVEERGGYPNIYRVQYKVLDLLLRHGICPKTSGFKLDTYHMYTEADSWITITLWDQS